MANAKFVKTAAAVALGASVVTTAVAPGAASAATTYKIKDGKLYKNGKIAKGYVVYKGKLYKNGKLNKGYAKVGTGSKMKLYFNSSLKKGFKTANNATLLFKDGVLFKGYKQAGSNERLYKDGKLTTGWEVYTDAEGVKFLYSKGYLYKNLKTAKRGGVTNLFENGKLAEGTKAFQDTLFTDGTVDEKDQVFEDVLYVGGKVPTAELTKFEEKYYDNKGKLANGEYTIDGKKVELKDGVVVVKDLVIETKAVGVKKIEVKFNKETPEVTAADFSVKKGANTTNISSVTIADDKKSAVIEVSSKLTEGEYTVAVKQADKDAAVSTVKVENEKIAKIELLGDVAPLNKNTDATSATLGLQVLNQYGEDITKTSAAGLKFTATGSGVTDATATAQGVVTLTGKDLKANDKVVVTVFDANTGVNTSKTITLSNAAVLADVTVGTLYNKDGKTLNQDSKLDQDKFYLPITLKDQYGKEITTVPVGNVLTLTKINENVATFGDLTKITIDGKDVIALPVETVNAAGTASVLAIANATGKNSTGTVTVAEGVKISSVTLSQSESTVTAGKDVMFPLTVTDSEGKAVTTKKGLDAIKDKVIVSSNATIEEVADKGLFVKVAGDKVKENTPITVTVTTTSGKVSTQTVFPKAKAVATTIVGLNKEAQTAIRAGKSVKVASTDLVVEDQYGQKLSKEGLAEVDFTVATATTGDKAPFTVEEGKVIKASADATATSDKLTFTLTTDKTGAGSFEQTYTVVKNADFASYAVKDVKPVYFNGTSVVPQDFVVTATTKDGKVVTLDPSEYNVTGVELENGKVTGTVDKKDFTNTTTVTKTATVVINASGETIKKDVTFSIVAPKAEKVQFVDATDKTKELSKLAVAVQADYKLPAAQIVVTDQYGSKNTVLAEAATVTFKPVSGKVTFTANGTTEAAVATAEAGSVVQATITSGDKTAVVEITFTAEK